MFFSVMTVLIHIHATVCQGPFSSTFSGTVNYFMTFGKLPVEQVCLVIFHRCFHLLYIGD